MIFLKRSVLFLALCLCSIQFATAQFIKLDRDALAFLAAEEKVNLSFTYNDLLFNSDELNEDHYLYYINKKLVRIFGDELANDWAQLYLEHKKKTFTTAFEAMFNKHISKFKRAPNFVINDTTANYTMNINSEWMYFGYGGNGPMAQPAKLSTEITFFKTSTPSDIISSVLIMKTKGSSFGDKYEIEGTNIPCLRCLTNSYERTAYKLALSFRRILK
jgi:hypothetical protein